ncbi:MAG: glycosyltransferase family 4 protein [Solirubrobacteraceae bacterium]|nr:glycosyltransferase family 4 protein [Solirubrobacteraceae bacterium]
MSRLTAVFSAPFVGGSEVFNLEFLTEAKARGVQITAVLPGHGELETAVRALTDDIVVVPIPRSLTDLSRFGSPTVVSQVKAAVALLAYAVRLRRAIRTTQGAIVALGLRAQLGVFVTGAARRRPLAWVVHEIVPAGRFGNLWARASTRAQIVLSFSPRAAHQPLLQRANVDLREPRIELAPLLAITAPSPNGPRTIGLVGDLVPLKNHLGFLRLVEQLRAERHPELQGLLVGRDVSASNDTASYTAQVREAVDAARGAVRLTQATAADMPAIYAELDLLVHLSTEPESFGRVIVEALAAGRPVVAFDRGAVSDLVSPEVGRLVAADDLASVADAIASILDDADRFVAMSAAARATAATRWDAAVPGRTVGEALATFSAT